MLIYVAGPYRGDVEQNIATARRVAIAVWESGNVCICPHLNTANFENDSQLADEVYLNGDLQILARCDALVAAPEWERSIGATAEIEFAKQRGIPVWFYPDLPKPHPTEIKCPQQVNAFMDVVMQMYRLHLDKNQDYSPANVIGCGEQGVGVRFYDKLARLMNLCGFDVQLRYANYSLRDVMLFELWNRGVRLLRRMGFHFGGTVRDGVRRSPKFESVEDSWLDAANYAVIGRLIHNDLWGK